MKTTLRAFFIAATILLVTGCSTHLAVSTLPPPQLLVTRAQAAIPSATDTPGPTPTRETATATPSPTETATPVPEATATWANQSGSEVTAPILLYHHVTDGDPKNRYAVSLAAFERQMKALKAWGYTSIPISALVQAVLQGGELPARPVVLTFDDGYEDIFRNAFPIMQRYGFTGTFYLVAERLGAPGNVDVDQLAEMIGAGWEIGSHGMTHNDLTVNHARLWNEVAKSRMDLEEALHVPVKTFSYPYGKIDPTVVKAVQEYGYQAAVRLDVFSTHTWATLYLLSRIEVRSSYDMETFASFLPWTETP